MPAGDVVALFANTPDGDFARSDGAAPVSGPSRPIESNRSAGGARRPIHHDLTGRSAVGSD